MPDLNVSYREESFDKDVGYCATDVTLEQRGAQIFIRKIHSENEHEVSRSDESGAITKIYEAENLVQITLNDGSRQYFDLKARRLRQNLEHLGGWFELDLLMSATRSSSRSSFSG